MAAIPIGPPQSAPTEQKVPLTKEVLIQNYGDILKKFVKDELEIEMEPERWIQVTQALRNRLYWEAKQYLRLAFRPDDSIGFEPIGILGAGVPGGSSTKEGPASFRYTFNITRADGAKVVAVLGQRAPHVEMVADDTEDENSEHKAQLANAAVRYFHDLLKIDRRQKDVVRHLWRTGPVFVYSGFVTDGVRFGYRELPVINDVGTSQIGSAGYRCTQCGTLNPQPVCQNCSQMLAGSSYEDQMAVDVPSDIGRKRLPKGGIVLDIADILEMTWPQHAKSIEECEWLGRDREVHKGKLLSIYGQEKPGMTDKQIERVKKLRETISKDSEDEVTSGEQAASDARKILLSQSVAVHQRKNSKRIRERWLRPYVYEQLPIDVPVRDQLYEEWPDGIKLVLVGDDIADVDHESMDDVWSVFKTGLDEKILSDALCNDLIPIQDIINHFFNLAIETILRSIPKIVVDSKLLDRKSIEENAPLPGEFIFARNTGGANFRDRMAETPMATLHPSLIQFSEIIRQMSREIDGVMESLFGGGEPSNTWRDAEMRKNQALMQLGTVYDEMVSGWERVYENILKQMSKYSDEVVKVPSEQIEGAVDTIDFSIFDGTGYHAEGQEGIPMSHAEEVDRLLFFWNQNNPQVASLLELTSDLNQKRVWELLKLRGFRSRRLMQKEKFMSFYLPQLLKGAPTQQPDPVTGQMQDIPSITPDNFEDDQVYISQLARDYLDGQGGLQLRQSNPTAYRNILAFGRLAQKMAAPPAQPAPSPTQQRAPGPQKPAPMAAGGQMAKAGAPPHAAGQAAPGPMTPPGAPTPPVQPMVTPQSQLNSLQ